MCILITKNYCICLDMENASNCLTLHKHQPKSNCLQCYVIFSQLALGMVQSINLDVHSSVCPLPRYRPTNANRITDGILKVFEEEEKRKKNKYVSVVTH